MKNVIFLKSKRATYRGLVFSFLFFFLSSGWISAQVVSYLSGISGNGGVTLDQMIRLDYGSLYNLDRDKEEGIDGNIYMPGSKIEVLVYAYDEIKSDKKGIEIYHIWVDKTTLPGKYVENHDNDVRYSIDFDIPFYTPGNNIKLRAQDAKLYLPGGCVPTKTYSDYFKSLWIRYALGNSECLEYFEQIQPVIVEVRTTGSVTFNKAKIPGIGVVKVVDDKVQLSPPGDFFNYCSGVNKSSPLCQLFNSVRNPNVSSSEDIFIAAHRGWWGYDLGTGPPENTKLAVQQAFQQDIKIVEMDLTITADNQLLFMHDYVMKRLTDYTGDEFSFELDWGTIRNYKARRRDNTISDVTLSRFFEVLNEVQGKSMIMMMDVKEQQSNGAGAKCKANCDFQDLEKQKQSWTKIVRQCIRQAESINAKKNLIVKTYYSPDEIYRLIGDQMFTVLWTPMIVLIIILFIKRC